MVPGAVGRMFAMMPSDSGEAGDCRSRWSTGDSWNSPTGMASPRRRIRARARRVSVTGPQRFATAELEAFMLGAYTLARAKLTKKRQAEPGPLPTIRAR